MLNIFDYISAFIRSFFLQALWNYENMQGTGLTYVMAPIIKKLYKTEPREKVAKILNEYMSFFNTNPFFFPAITGILIKEESRIRQAQLGREEIQRIKLDYMGPIAALGDNIIWAKMNSFFALLSAFVFILLFWYQKEALYWLPAILYLVGFNGIILYFRILFFSNGLSYGKDFVEYLAKIKVHLNRLEQFLNIGALVLLGGVNASVFMFLEPQAVVKDKILLNILEILFILYILGIYLIVRFNLKRRYTMLYILVTLLLIFIVRG